jgi:biotin operon repressor BirA-like protein
MSNCSFHPYSGLQLRLYWMHLGNANVYWYLAPPLMFIETRLKPLLIPLLRQLSDGRFHSGEDLAHLLGVSRATVWQALSDATALGLKIFRVRGRGYQLESPIDFIDGEKVMTALGDASPFDVEVLDSVDSTNTLLLERARRDGVHGACIAAELPQRSCKLMAVGDRGGLGIPESREL